MNYNKELIDIIKNKKFKTFWHCLDFLLLSGYSPMEAFGVSLHEFGESKVFSDVAFIRTKFVHDIEVIMRTDYGNIIRDPFTGERHERPQIKYGVTVGLIDETNLHLSGLYKTYRKWYMEDKFITPQFEIEDTCEKIEIKELSSLILDYLFTISKSHFGVEVFKTPEIPTNDNLNRIKKGL